MSSLLRAVQSKTGGKRGIYKLGHACQARGVCIEGGEKLSLAVGDFKEVEPNTELKSKDHGAVGLQMQSCVFGSAGSWLGQRGSWVPWHSPWAERLIPKPLAELITLSWAL